MSALEPDAPAPHIFPHWREAIRAWAAHRAGQGPSRPGLGEVRGKGPTVSDLLRVGQLLADLDLLQGEGELTPIGARVVECALAGAAGRGADQRLKSAVQRLNRWARKMRIVSPALPRRSLRHDSWQDVGGEWHETTYCVESS